MYKLMSIVATCIALSGCASNDLSVKTDSYSGEKIVSSEYFYSLLPVNKWSEVDRIAFKYDYVDQSNMLTLRAGYLTGAGSMTGVREGITNVNGVGFMIDGQEETYQPTTMTNYDGLKSCNEIGICSVADGSYNSFSIPVSLLDEIQEAQTVKVKLTLGNYRKVAILKDGEDKSDAYNVLLKLDEMVNKK
ncbi:TPA: hypothetical protein NGT52_004726 [Vibrio parahaemolyticus]|uniref:hypothetical protein n=1 Tax=Vibrio diabolicus TaxID=50719 RepID=UPI003750E2E4|nr:hypothetical protein [Vibrio parahaemolyticus]